MGEGARVDATRESGSSFGECACVRGACGRGCGTDTASPTGYQLTTLRVAMFPGGASLPVHAAVEKGIFEQNGLRVELTEGPDLPVFMAALAKGQYDIVMSVPTLVMIGARKALMCRSFRVCSARRRSAPTPCGSPRMPRSNRLGNSGARPSRCLH